MAWIKRNLFFVIGAVVSLALLGFAGFYNYSGWRHNTEAKEARIKAYEELKRLNNLPVHPGSGKVDNIQAARDQQKAIRALINKTGKYFTGPPSIPAMAPEATNISSSQFTSALRETVNQLSREANNASVLLPPDYKFSFSQQFRLLTFQGGLENLAVQMGEIKILCTELFKAKINSLDSIQRARVSPDDLSGPPTDYLFDLMPVTNQLAVVTPYQITFRSFSPEIAQVLAAFANSPFGIIVENMQVAPAASMPGESVTSASYAPSPGNVAPLYRSRLEEEAAAFAARFPTAATATRSTGPQILVNERPLQVTLAIKMVRLLPQK